MRPLNGIARDQLGIVGRMRHGDTAGEARQFFQHLARPNTFASVAQERYIPRREYLRRLFWEREAAVTPQQSRKLGFMNACFDFDTKLKHDTAWKILSL